MTNVTLGKYITGQSFFHRLDPRCKFILLFVLMITIFVNIGYFGYGIIFILLLISYFVAKINFLMIFKSLKPMWFMMFFLFILNCFIVKTGTPYTIWKITIYSDAILNTVNVVCRLILLIGISTLLTATTKPLDITIDIEDLFGFLKKFKINVHILSMMISIALRFIPTILEETYRIMKAQASRGVDLINGKLKEKFVAITALIIPLFISAFTISEELANAMEARNYNPYGKRTRYRNFKWKTKDSLVLITCVIIMVGFIVLKCLNLNLDNLILGVFL